MYSNKILPTSKTNESYYRVVITEIYVVKRASTCKNYIFSSMTESFNSSALSCPNDNETSVKMKNMGIIKQLSVLNKPCTNKPFTVGLDIAKIAGFVETDSLIALST